MKSKQVDLVSLFKDALQGESQKKLHETGLVIQVGDGICKIYGLTNVVYGELVDFEGGNKGIILNLTTEYASAFLLHRTIPVSEQEVVKRTGKILQVPVGQDSIGRVVSALGQPLDELGDITSQAMMPVESEPPSIMDRSPVNESLETGIIAIDALIPIGKGQRELIIGNRNTGKTAVAIDTILHQKGKDVICVYVSIGQRQGNLARLVNFLKEHGGMDYTIVVSADSSDSVLNQYLAPYSGTAIAEYFMQQGKDVLIVYDDLSNHAVAYREMSLLMRRAPGREAYPGDVFYLHSRLLERSGKLKNGGSLTALPIIQIQGDDITAYIPTNLISITDGQIFLDTQLFNKGRRPAVNVELSVSRVGGSAQTKAIKRMTKALRLELAQYQDLLGFAQFGTELDDVSQRQLKRGHIIVEVLKQPQFVHYNFVDQSLILFLVRYNFLDTIPKAKVQDFIRKFVSYVPGVYKEVYDTIYKAQDIDERSLEKLKGIAKEFSQVFATDL